MGDGSEIEFTEDKGKETIMTGMPDVEVTDAEREIALRTTIADLSRLVVAAKNNGDVGVMKGLEEIRDDLLDKVNGLGKEEA